MSIERDLTKLLLGIFINIYLNWNYYLISHECTLELNELLTFLRGSLWYDLPIRIHAI